MERISKFAGFVVVLTLAFGIVPLAFAAGTGNADTGVQGKSAGAQKSEKIVILYTNDVHCGIDANIVYAGLAAYKADKLDETDYVTLIDAGDAIQGEAVGTLSKGSYITDIMNFVGYDYAVPGNHEFDYGMNTFLELAKKADYEYICCNFMDLKTGNTVFAPYALETYGSTKVAYIGIGTPESFVKSTPAYFQDDKGNYIYDFCNDASGEKLYKQVQNTIDQVTKKEKADYIIAVGHLGTDEQSSPWTSREVIANTEGLDAFIDAHSHSIIAGETVKDRKGDAVILTSTGTKLSAIGELTIEGGKVSSKLAADYGKKDAAVEKYINEIKAGYEKLLTRTVGKSSYELTINGEDGTRAVRSAETNLGDFCTDAYRTVLGTDIAFVNGGGVRESIPAGDITYGQIIAVHPFGNMACSVEADGREIADALEMASRNAPAENGGFLQVSGLSYAVNTDIPSAVTVDDKGMFTGVKGKRRVQNITVGGEPIDFDRTYTLASHNYMIKNGGDGINMFTDNKIVQDEVMIDNQVLITYMEEYLGGSVGAAYKEPQGRITVAGSGLPFTDLKGYGWARDAISYVYENGILFGTGETAFSPAAKATYEMLDHALLGKAPESGSETVTREDLAVIVLDRLDAVGKGPVGAWMINLDYNDAEKISDYAWDAVAFCRIKNIMGGYEDGSFRPKDAVTRAELAVTMKNLSEVTAAE